MNSRNILATGLGCLFFAAALQADTLFLRDGRRVDGTLLSVRDGVVEFDAQRGGLFGGRERVRIDRRDVLRVEFDEPRFDRDDRDRDRDGRFGDRDDRDRRDNRDDRNGRPAGLRERDVRVNARDAWTNTGIQVRAGQTVFFSASGKVRWGPGRQDGPDGEHGSPKNQARPIPSRPAAALIGRIGEGNDIFFIGSDREGIRMRSGGTLYLGVNDDFLQDNSGAFQVTVYY